MTTPTPAGWYPDPSGTGGVRWWDGGRWTEHVQQTPPSTGQPAPPTGPGGPSEQQTAPEPASPQQPLPGQATAWQQRSAMEQLGGQQPPAARQPGVVRSPYTEQRMFVSQKRKLIELTNEYAIFGTDGHQIGAVTEIEQSGLKKAMRFITSFDQFMTHRIQVNDSQGQTLITLTRPAKIMKSTLIVARPDGTEIGRLVQRNVFGKIRFGMEAGGTEIGSLNAENWRAWNFAILDQADTEVARITKSWEGLLTTMFTTADNYLVDIHVPLSEPMHSLVVAAALTVDTALKQDSRGWG